MLRAKKQYLRPVGKTIRLDTSRKDIWEVISSPGSLEYFHPFCESNPVNKWPGENSVDYVHYYNGLKFIRKFTKWRDGIGYALLIGKENGRRSRVIWQIDEISSTCSDVSITIYPHDIKRYPSFARPLIYYLYIKPALRRYLSSVLRGLQFYLATATRVRKNQFGVHKWFSN